MEPEGCTFNLRRRALRFISARCKSAERAKRLLPQSASPADRRSPAMHRSPLLWSRAPRRDAAGTSGEYIDRHTKQQLRPPAGIRGISSNLGRVWYEPQRGLKLAGGCGVIEAGEQAGTVGARPRQRLAVIIQARSSAQPRRDGGRGTGPGLAGQACVGARGGVLVVVQQPLHRLLTAGKAGGVVASVAATQVMHAYRRWPVSVSNSPQLTEKLQFRRPVL
jgi:hypothetical protein